MIWRMKNRLRYLAPHNARRKAWIRCTARLADCVSWHGFHYDLRGAHPLQKYASGLVEGADIRQLRAAYLEFLRFYRPVNAAQAWGLPDLEARLPMWIWPWKRALASDFVSHRAWRETPARCRDLLTNFSEGGILSYRIEEEWMWSERAHESLRSRGYQPARGLLRAHTLHADDGRVAHILMDGNHRAAALRAQGVERVEILSERRFQVYESDVCHWPGVASGQFSRAAALQIFHRFIEGNDCCVTTDVPARIIAPPGWMELYCAPATDWQLGQK